MALGDTGGGIQTPAVPMQDSTGALPGTVPESRAPRRDGTRDGAGWTGFLLVSFALVGLVGALSTYASQIPFERAMARNAALDRVLALAEPSGTAGSDSFRVAVDGMREQLGDSADRLLQPASQTAAVPSPAVRVAEERSRMLQAFNAESEDIGFRLRLVIAVFTAAATLFGVAILSVVRKAARD